MWSDEDQTDLKELDLASPEKVSNKEVAMADSGVQTDQNVELYVDIEVQTESPLCVSSGAQTDELADKLFIEKPEKETQTDTQEGDIQSHVEDMIDGLCKGMDAFAIDSNDKVDKLSETTLEMCTHMKVKLESIEQKVKSQSDESEGKKEIMRLNSEISDLKIRMMAEKDKWLCEKIEITKANGNLRLKLEEAKSDYQEKMRVEREGWSVERERFLKENWSLNVEISKIRKQESDTIVKKPVSQVRYTDIKFSAGLNTILSSLGKCKLRWRNQVYESTELPYFLEKLFHINCPIDPEQQNKIADELIDAAKVGTLEVKRISKRIPNFPQWDDCQEAVMRQLQIAKFSQNPDCKAALEATGGTILRHPVSERPWDTLFPKILTEIRDGVKPKLPPSPKPQPTHPSSSAPQQHSIVFAGDSVFNDMKLNEVHKGKGNTFVKVSKAENLDKITLKAEPNLKPTLVTNVGINNLRDGESAEATAHKIKENLHRIQGEVPNSKILYVETLCRPADMCSIESVRLNSIMKQYCNENYITFVEQSDLKRQNAMRDDFHPNGTEGIVLYMNAILNHINEPVRMPQQPRNLGRMYPQQNGRFQSSASHRRSKSLDRGMQSRKY